ncbi:hypothetical protein PQR64_37905 [Paraburkholderia phytofirmans]|uniref:hypothetical protein n=1 Tax=Paraburkholderia phytofirmans TaxID=261302 RepID=UPI0038BC50EF
MCVTGATKEAAEATHAATEGVAKKKGEEDAFSPDVEHIRQIIENPFLNRIEANTRLGVALSGGGAKASSFGMGILAGLADSDELGMVDFISSVSGGSYAAYFYYAHEIFPRLRHDREPPVASELFADCIRASGLYEVTPDIEERLKHSGMCPDRRKPDEFKISDHYKFQEFAGCMQDIFRPSLCTFKHTPDGSGVPGYAIIGTLGFAPISNITNTLFDWGLGVSASAQTYKNGIGIAYGSTISESFEFVPARSGKPVLCKNADSKTHVDTDEIAEVLDCQAGTFEPKPEALTFEELRVGLLKAAAAGNRLPYWIVNATAPRHRSGLGWLLAVDRQVDNDIFEFTALTHGSPRYGYVSTPASLHKMTVLDAVAASAAFLDANQQSYTGYKRGFIGLGLHIANLDWGLDIRNYNVSDDRAKVHRVLPYPINLLDGAFSMAGAPDAEEDRVRSVYIRLIDGGNSDDLGAYSLIKRNTRNILISDAAQDESGKFEDVCKMRSILKLAPQGTPRFLYLPGLQSLAAHCDSEDDGMSYDIHHWSIDFPVLLGCVRALEQPADSEHPCANLADTDIRLFVVKPAVDIPRFLRNQWKGLENPITSCWLANEASSSENDIRLLNCETSLHIQANWEPSQCLSFPQNKTVNMTANSSKTLYSAYRELARQYTYRALEILRPLVANDSDPVAISRYERELDLQRSNPETQVPTQEITKTCSPAHQIQANN